jgi:glycosyltransferase involved in cell wall biosynthesis
MALKVPWIASQYPTYDELHDFGLMTENGELNWMKALTEMIENYPEYKKKAETVSYEFALEQTGDKNIEKTLALYQKLIDSPYP